MRSSPEVSLTCFLSRKSILNTKKKGSQVGFCDADLKNLNEQPIVNLHIDQMTTVLYYVYISVLIKV